MVKRIRRGPFFGLDLSLILTHGIEIIGLNE